MRTLKLIIPSVFTSANLLLGSVSIILSLTHNILIAAYLIFGAAIFDFLDGFIARLINVGSLFGKELDSMADMVSFGVAPGIIMYQLLNNAIENHNYIPYISLLIPLFSAYRLAKFNIDTKQSENFVGLPTPANAIFIASLQIIINSDSEFSQIIAQILTAPVLIFISIIMSLLLVLPIKLIAIKMKTYGLRENLLKYILIIGSIILYSILQFSAIPLIIIFYLMLSIVGVSFLRKLIKK